jgi:hypothetical protein
MTNRSCEHPTPKGWNLFVRIAPFHGLALAGIHSAGRYPTSSI